VVATAEDIAEALQAAPISFPPDVLDVEPITAETIARLDHEDGPPALLRNRCGKGEAILFTTAAESLRGQEAFAAVVHHLTVVQPTLLCSDAARRRYRFILTRVADKHVLHVIDPVAEGPRFQATEVEISLRTKPLGEPDEARMVGAAKTLTVHEQDGLITFRVRPDPVASVVLYRERRPR
jgi:hypothetical protein